MNLYSCVLEVLLYMYSIIVYCVSLLILDVGMYLATDLTCFVLIVANFPYYYYIELNL